MKLLPLRTNLNPGIPAGLPLAVYTVGTENQQHIVRLEGFSAMQLLSTFSGSGRFRVLGDDNWETLAKDHILYIPQGLAHEYRPARDHEPWMVGFVSFKGIGEGWDFGDQPRLFKTDEIASTLEGLERIWSHSGPHHNLWSAAAELYGYLTELRRLTLSYEQSESINRALAGTGISAVQRTTRFMQEHLSREMFMTDLSEQMGYSQRQMTRLFLQAFGKTPLQYLKGLRLNSAALILTEQPELPVQQIAGLVGMEPVYFSRMFRRTFGMTPSEYRRSTGRLPQP